VAPKNAVNKVRVKNTAAVDVELWRLDRRVHRLIRQVGKCAVDLLHGDSVGKPLLRL